MAINNLWCFSKSYFDWKAFSQATHNQYRVVKAKPYSDKKGILPNGVSMTLTILCDDFDYGLDKEGNPRNSNLYENFDVTVLNDKLDVKKGDIITLLDFDPEHSGVIRFDAYLRFKDAKVIKRQTPAQGAAQSNA